MNRALVAVPLLLTLGGCVTTGTTSIKGSECKFLERPRYAVKGAQRYDQDWIDSTIEGGVGACKWKRPAARPAELDAPRKGKETAAPVKPPKVTKAAKVKGWLWRALPTLAKKKAAPVAAPVPAPALVPIVVTTVPIAPPPAPPAPRSAIEDLLHIDESKWERAK